MQTQAIALAVITSLLVPLAGAAQSKKNREEFSAVAITAGGPLSRGGAGQLDIVIERYSTQAEQKRLLDSMKQGQDAMLETLRKLPRVGYIRTPPNLGWDLHYAHTEPGEDGGRRIFLATDRPIGVWEAANRPRTIEYPFTFIEMRINNDGEGEGKLSRAAKVEATEDLSYIQLENYEGQPVDLTNVKRRR